MIAKPKGNQAEELLENVFRANKIEFEKFGREHTIKNKIISKKMNFDFTATGLDMRFNPDYICYNKNLFYAEAKTGITLQRLAHQVYKGVEDRGVNIYLFFLYHNTFRFCKPSEVPFFEVKTDSMLHKRTGLRIPVEDNIWIQPRMMSQKNLMKFKKVTKSSGTSFAYLDKDKMNKLPSLKIQESYERL